MPTSVATLDPAETISAAVHEFREQLRQIVDRASTDDPSLLDEVGKLTGRIRARINRARKRDQPPGKPTAPAPAATTPTAVAPAASTTVVPKSTSIPTPSVPAAITARPTGERVSVKLAEPPRPTLPATRTAPVAAPTSAPRRGRHRIARRRRWLTPLLLVVTVLILVAATLLACTVDTNAAQDTPRAPVEVSMRPDVALTAPLQPVGLAPPGTHAAFPGLVQYPGRTLTLAWRQGSDHVEARDGAIVTATSWDAGLSYHNPTTVLDDDEDNRDPSLTAIGDELWMTYFTGSQGLAAEGAYVIRGNRAPVRIDRLPYAAIAAPVVQLPDGSVGAVYYGHAAGETRDSVYFAWSTNGGADWTSKRIADGHAAGRDYQEPWLVVRGGALHVTHRYGSWDSVGITSSTDGGVNWTAPRKILDRATGRPTTLALASGLMLMIYRHTETRAAVMATSRDGGATWRSAGVLVAPPGPLGMTYGVAAEVLPGVAHVVVAGEALDGSSTLSSGYVAEAAR